MYVLFLTHTQKERNQANMILKILASASYDDTIHIYTDDGGADDWASTCVLKGHASTVWSIAFSPYGEHLASVSDDRTIRIWKRGGKGSRDRWTEVAKLEEAHERTIYHVAWAKGPESEAAAEGEGRKKLGWLATAGADGRLKVYAVSVRSGPHDRG
jgi:cytosolic iron-sulfur protein assembly protein CIAO1